MGGAPAAGNPLDVEIDYECTARFESPAFAITVRDAHGVDMIHLSPMPISGYPISDLHGRGQVVLNLPRLPLTASRYYLDVGICRGRVEWLFCVENVAEFDVEARDAYDSGFAPGRQHGAIVLEHRWSHRASTDGPSS